MGFIKNILNRWFGGSATVRELPSGSVTVNLQGGIVSSTVSQVFPQSALQQVGQDVVALFREARAAQMPLAEVSLQFGSLLITARELRGGAVIFLLPQTTLMPRHN